MSLEDRENKRKSVVGMLVNRSQPVEKEKEKEIIIPDAENAYVIGKPDDERKSKRVNLLIKPSVYDKVRVKCDYMNISLNECINQLLSTWADN